MVLDYSIGFPTLLKKLQYKDTKKSNGNTS